MRQSIADRFFENRLFIRLSQTGSLSDTHQQQLVNDVLTYMVNNSPTDISPLEQQTLQTQLQGMERNELFTFVRGKQNTWKLMTAQSVNEKSVVYLEADAMGYDTAQVIGTAGFEAVNEDVARQMAQKMLDDDAVAWEVDFASPDQEPLDFFLLEDSIQNPRIVDTPPQPTTKVVSQYHDDPNQTYFWEGAEQWDIKTFKVTFHGWSYIIVPTIATAHVKSRSSDLDLDAFQQELLENFARLYWKIGKEYDASKIKIVHKPGEEVLPAYTRADDIFYEIEDITSWKPGQGDA